MAYGSIKVDTIVFTNNSVDQSVSISGIIASTSGNLTVTGTISGSTVQATYGTFTNLTGVTTSGTNANFQTITGATGVFTASLSGATILSPTGTFTSLTGTTTTGTTANFVSGVFSTQVSGATITGTTVATTTGTFVSLTGTTATFTSGIIASGTFALPSLAILSDPNTGIYSPGADALAISTNGTGRLFVAADGKVGVGVGSPASALQVIGVATFGNGIGGRLQATTDSNLGYIDSLNNTSTQFQTLIHRGTEIQFHTNTAGVTPVEKIRITSAGFVGIGTSAPNAILDIANASFQAVRTNLSSITDTFHQYRGTPDGAGYEHARVFSGRDASVHTYGSFLAFYTEGKTSGTTDTSVERFRIDSSGRLLVGTSTFAGKGLSFMPGGGIITDCNGTITFTHIEFKNNNGSVGSIQSTGSSTAYNTSSDYRLKENIKPVTNGITRLQQLKPSRFNFITDQDTVVDGFIAHEAQEVVPECVTGKKDAVDNEGNPVYQGIDQSKLVPLLTAALQEAIAKIESLEARLTAAGI